jgi:hypothetical protein
MKLYSYNLPELNVYYNLTAGLYQIYLSRLFNGTQAAVSHNYGLPVRNI